MPLAPLNISGNAARGMGIEIDMDPSPLLLVASFDKLGLDIRSFKEPLKRSIQKVAAPSLQKNFDQQGRPDRWAELSDDTVNRKYQLGFPSASFPLVRTGAGRRVAGQLNAWKIDGIEGVATMDLPESVDYMRIHQEGANEGVGGSVWVSKNRRTGVTQTVTRGGKGFVPQRLWAILQDEDMDDIERVFEDWIQERAFAAGFH